MDNLAQLRQSAINQGSLDDLLACTSIWKFEPGELDEILQDIEQSRWMELEHTCDELFEVGK